MPNNKIDLAALELKAHSAEAWALENPNMDPKVVLGIISYVRNLELVAERCAYLLERDGWPAYAKQVREFVANGPVLL